MSDFDARSGFDAKPSQLSAFETGASTLPSSITCYFTQADKKESVHFLVQESAATVRQEDDIVVTIHKKVRDEPRDDEDEEHDDTATLSCKVKSQESDLRLEVEWELPSRPSD